MRVRLLLLSLIVMVLAVNPAAATVSVPAPSQSTVDPCLVVDPLGDFTFRVVVRDIAGLPIPNSFVQFSLCGCSGVIMCPGVSCQQAQITDVNGVATFKVSAGGVCGGPVLITADGVILASRGVASPDQNGDLVVDATDVSILSLKLATPDLTGDFDCDGLVTSFDMTIQAQHLNHNCGAIPTTPASWGKMKSIYR